jgi:7-cyano-7-deazaguanine synthase
MLFLLMGAAYAYQQDANAVSIGLLKEDSALFGDQTRQFLKQAEDLLKLILGCHFLVLAPLMEMTKAHVVNLAKEKGIHGTWSCHRGGPEPCGVCIACCEYEGLEV